MERYGGKSKPEKATKRDANLNTHKHARTHTHPIYAVSLAAHLIFGLLYSFYGWRKCTCIGVVLEQVVGAIDHFTSDGVVLTSGDEIKADMVIYGTGLFSSYFRTTLNNVVDCLTISCPFFGLLEGRIRA